MTRNKPPNRSHLTLCNPKEDAIHRLPTTTKSEDILKSNLVEISPQLLDLYENLVQGKISRSKLRRRNTSHDRISDSEKWLNIQHHTNIRLLNDQGDAEVKVQFEVANLSLINRASRSHFFWWEHPQTGLEFTCQDGNQKPLRIELVQSYPHFSEVEVIFPNVIKTFEKYSYEISFHVSNAFLNHQFYFLRPLTATKKLSLSVIERENYNFKNGFIAIESIDGFRKDNAPGLITKTEGMNEVLSWEINSPTFGDFFKTFWNSEKRLNKLQPESKFESLCKASR